MPVEKFGFVVQVGCTRASHYYIEGDDFISFFLSKLDDEQQRKCEKQLVKNVFRWLKRKTQEKMISFSSRFIRSRRLMIII